MLWFSNLGNIYFWIQYLFGLSMSEVCDVMEIWWLGYWATQYTLHDRQDVSIPL